MDGRAGGRADGRTDGRTDGHVATASPGLVQYAKLQFDCGNYSLSGELLKHFRSMPQDPERPLGGTPDAERDSLSDALLL